MADEINLIDRYNEIIKKANILADKINKYKLPKIDEMVNRSYEEFGQYQQSRIKEIFNTAVKTFYDSYPAQTYKNKRRGSLYDVLDIKTDELGRVSDGLMVATSAPDYRGLFDPDNTTDRKGNSLFEKVFVEGWHGGAEGIEPGLEEMWGKHPSPGTPYYRKGGIVKKTGRYYKYAKWGRKAERTESPYSMIERELLEAERGDIAKEYQNVFSRNAAKLREDVNRQLEIYAKEIFG